VCTNLIDVDCCVCGVSYTGKKEMQSNESAADDVDGCHGDDDVKYSFSTVHNVDLYGCELAPTVREGMRAWNMTVQYWLATYVYKRLPVKTAALRLCILDLVMAALIQDAKNGHFGTIAQNFVWLYLRN